jgi:hypothetical protein
MSIISSLKLPSERSFGLMLTAVSAILGAYEIIRHRGWIVYGAFFMASVVLGLLTLIIPHALAPLNKAWFLLGERFGKIVSPIVLGIIFFQLSPWPGCLAATNSS